MKIELFDAKQHDRSSFESGSTQLDEYLRKHLSQNVKKGVVRAYIATDDTGVVSGYYTLSAASVGHEDMPDSVSKKLPRYPVPAVLIGRMASSLAARGAGLRVGSNLLMHALQQALVAADSVGVVCVIVDAKPEAVAFYERFGFMRLKREDTLRFYLPVGTIRRLVG